MAKLQDLLDRFETDDRAELNGEDYDECAPRTGVRNSALQRCEPCIAAAHTGRERAA
jgi:hypothetical protein